MSDNTIMLTRGFRHEEALAGEALTPGHILEQTSAAAQTVQKHATEGGFWDRAVAVEDALQGAVITTAYASGALVMYAIVNPGDKCRIFLKAGEDISIGDKLVSDGAGRLIAEGSVTSGVTVKQIVEATEALDLSDSGDVDTLIAVRVL